MELAQHVVGLPRDLLEPGHRRRDRPDQAFRAAGQTGGGLLDLLQQAQLAGRARAGTRGAVVVVAAGAFVAAIPPLVIFVAVAPGAVPDGPVPHGTGPDGAGMGVHLGLAGALARAHAVAFLFGHVGEARGKRAVAARSLPARGGIVAVARPVRRPVGIAVGFVVAAAHQIGDLADRQHTACGDRRRRDRRAAPKQKARRQRRVRLGRHAIARHVAVRQRPLRGIGRGAVGFLRPVNRRAKALVVGAAVTRRRACGQAGGCAGRAVGIVVGPVGHGRVLSCFGAHRESCALARCSGGETRQGRGMFPPGRVGTRLWARGPAGLGEGRCGRDGPARPPVPLSARLPQRSSRFASGVPAAP